MALAPDDQKQLDALLKKQSEAQQKEAEANRLAQYAPLKPIEAVLTPEFVDKFVGALSAVVTTDRDVRQRVDRLVTVMSIDGKEIADKIAALSKPVPVMPVMTPPMAA